MAFVNLIVMELFFSAFCFGIRSHIFKEICLVFFFYLFIVLKSRDVFVEVIFSILLLSVIG